MHLGLPASKWLLSEMCKWFDAHGRGDRVGIIQDFLEYYYPTYSRKGGEMPDIEDVLGMLETARIYSSVRSPGRGFKYKPGKIEELTSRLLRCLSEYIWSFQGTDVAALEQLRRLVRAAGQQVAYITFNYDLMLEAALSLEGLPFHYGLHIEPGFVNVLKPHGSVNWFNGAQIHPNKLAAHFMMLGDAIAVYPHFDSERLPFNTWKAPVIIPPTPNKQVETRDLGRMWTSFSSFVNSTRKLYIIGYSMPAADRLARIVLWRAGPKNSLSRKIRVINPCGNGEDRTFRELISPACMIIKSRFEDWSSRADFTI